MNLTESTGSLKPSTAPWFEVECPWRRVGHPGRSAAASAADLTQHAAPKTAAATVGFTLLELLIDVLFCDGHVESPRLTFVFKDEADVALVRWNRDHLPHREALLR